MHRPRDTRSAESHFFLAARLGSSSGGGRSCSQSTRKDIMPSSESRAILPSCKLRSARAHRDGKALVSERGARAAAHAPFPRAPWGKPARGSPGERELTARAHLHGQLEWALNAFWQRTPDRADAERDERRRGCPLCTARCAFARAARRLARRRSRRFARVGQCVAVSARRDDG